MGRGLGQSHRWPTAQPHEQLRLAPLAEMPSLPGALPVLSTGEVTGRPSRTTAIAPRRAVAPLDELRGPLVMVLDERDRPRALRVGVDADTPGIELWPDAAGRGVWLARRRQGAPYEDAALITFGLVFGLLEALLSFTTEDDDTLTSATHILTRWRDDAGRGEQSHITT